MSVATSHHREVTNAFAAATSIWGERLEAAGRHSIRYGLVLVLLWIGGMKFTAYEAEGISGLVANSPLMAWAYQILGTRPFSAAVGVAELVIAMLIAARPYSAKTSALGSLLAIGMFLTTLSFMLSGCRGRKERRTVCIQSRQGLEAMEGQSCQGRRGTGREERIGSAGEQRCDAPLRCNAGTWRRSIA